MALKTVLVTGANGYIGNAVARAFVGAGWTAYGLIRSESSAESIAAEEITPVIGSIDDAGSHEAIQRQLPPTLDAIVSATDDATDYAAHFENVIRLLRLVSVASTRAGTKPLVIHTSGCKDYGVGPHYAQAPGLAPHTEESPVNPPDWAIPRATCSLTIFDHADAFSPVLVRPTNVHGRSASYYRGFFETAEKTASRPGTPLVLTAPANSICHSMHVDDCADAYVAIAAHARRDEVAGQTFNISARAYETVDDIGRALVAEYGIGAGVKYVDPAEVGPDAVLWPQFLIDFPQWTGSDKLRRVTGWADHRPLFVQGLRVYRLAYEAAERAGHENIGKIRCRIGEVDAD